MIPLCSYCELKVTSLSPIAPPKFSMTGIEIISPECSPDEALVRRALSLLVRDAVDIACEPAQLKILPDSQPGIAATTPGRAAPTPGIAAIPPGSHPLRRPSGTLGEKPADRPVLIAEIVAATPAATPLVKLHSRTRFVVNWMGPLPPPAPPGGVGRGRCEATRDGSQPSADAPPPANMMNSHHTAIPAPSICLTQTIRRPTSSSNPSTIMMVSHHHLILRSTCFIHLPVTHTTRRPPPVAPQAPGSPSRPTFRPPQRPVVRSRPTTKLHRQAHGKVGVIRKA
ncbi:hypothetical protein PAPYR_11109 [Paratrimastix pyriformis]|uniref:Uncharacterized protein n=1 Tax=Paratrimastix pyriformis TaxID=342808 RepID=A0ABQ8UBP8_9EUKA|nr:hypothetical protein PAPYR_11109 [Paratrimastix pyriformis]